MVSEDHTRSEFERSKAPILIAAGHRYGRDDVFAVNNNETQRAQHVGHLSQAENQRRPLVLPVQNRLTVLIVDLVYLHFVECTRSEIAHL